MSQSLLHQVNRSNLPSTPSFDSKEGSQSLLHQVNRSNEMEYKEAVREASRNPFFIRSIVPTQKGKPLIIKAWRRNPFFIRSIVPTESEFADPHVTKVAIPSSSGQSFQRLPDPEPGVFYLGRNPFFIRSIVPTTAAMLCSSPRASCRNPFFIRSIVPTSQTLGIPNNGICRNPFFIRSIVPTWENKKESAGRLSRNPFFIRSIVPTLMASSSSTSALRLAIPSSSGQSFQLLRAK